MKNKGLTLIELITAMVITAIVSLAITVYFVSEHRFRGAIRDRIELSREARIAMNHMTRVLRFAKSVDTAVADQITAVIEGGPEGDSHHHLDFITNDNTTVVYTRNADNTLTYTQGENAPVEIARNITNFPQPIWKDPELGIQLTASDGDNVLSIQTKIRALPE